MNQQEMGDAKAETPPKTNNEFEPTGQEGTAMMDQPSPPGVQEVNNDQQRSSDSDSDIEFDGFPGKGYQTVCNNKRKRKVGTVSGISDMSIDQRDKVHQGSTFDNAGLGLGLGLGSDSALNKFGIDKPGPSRPRVPHHLLERPIWSTNRFRAMGQGLGLFNQLDLTPQSPPRDIDQLGPRPKSNTNHDEQDIAKFISNLRSKPNTMVVIIRITDSEDNPVVKELFKSSVVRKKFLDDSIFTSLGIEKVTPNPRKNQLVVTVSKAEKFDEIAELETRKNVLKCTIPFNNRVKSGVISEYQKKKSKKS